ncbi:hypothetical protein U9M48_000324 [Paspalum notatum var. saurae]|uniref:Uncharacterized protein n=1 Tax=Paspalum notatum var. saurae TaxID=547442 RepID=A0AAQ3PM55_PASNO
MADIVMGTMGSLVPKLFELLKEEYNLQTEIKNRIRSLTGELEDAQAALRKVAQVPWDQLDEQVQLWAREVRELSYDMEDVLDIFLVQVKGRDSAKKEGSLKRLGEKMANLFKKSKARREISVGVEDIMTHLDEVTKRCPRYKVNDIMARPAIASTVDPRLSAMYNKVKNLVGIDKSSSELISMLQTEQRGDVPNAKVKIVSVVGVGGLGKTTLAKAVYDKLKGNFEHWAFVPVGRNPDLKKVFKDILIDLDKHRYLKYSTAILDERQLIDELRSFFLDNKRYFIVIDDIWEVQSWETIKLAFDGDDDNNQGARMIITTRKIDVATKASAVYKLQPLPNDSSRELFCTRMSGDQGSLVDNKPNEISNKILKKCGGIPLAIITMASLLTNKPRDKWYEIYKTIGFGHKNSNEGENTTMRILSFSYYDMPLHLRTCLLYLGAFPEDSIIDKGALIWRWVAEGFIHEEQGTWLFETGEGYFNDLINRSLIQGVQEEDVNHHNRVDSITGCRVHDIVLDFIRFMSYKENFFTILDINGQGPPSKSPPVRRLAHHNLTMAHAATHQANNHFTEAKQTVRSFSAHGCAIESWAPLCSFTLLRVLAIEDCNPVGGRRLCVEQVGHLLHLRYLSLRGTHIRRIPEEIGGLRFLQTVDLERCNIVETPSGSSLPTQLVCLRIQFDQSGPSTNNGDVGWVGRLTSLEELFIDERLQHLQIRNSSFRISEFEAAGWEAARFVLPRQLRLLYVGYPIKFRKLPPCINPWGLPNLSHLFLRLRDVDEQDLRNLGCLPELRCLFLAVDQCSAAISSNIIINDSSNVACYFPKLRRFRLVGAMVLLFVANNKEDGNKKVVSFHLWDGSSDISLPPLFDSEGDELQRSMSAASTATAYDDHGNKEEGSICIGKQGATTALPRCRFMPSLQVLEFYICGKATLDHHSWDNLMGWEYLSSLQEINVYIWQQPIPAAAAKLGLQKVEAVLRRAADEHPNRPTLHVDEW